MNEVNDNLKNNVKRTYYHWSDNIWFDELLALGEVTARLVTDRLPILQRMAHSRARRPSRQSAQISLMELKEQILRLGYQPGSDLLVHASLVRQLNGGLDDLIGMLCQLVGATGTLLMPSHPILLERDGMNVYDVQKSRSQVGMLSERFRRTAGVLRSPFPIAPVCAIGINAKNYTRDFSNDSGNTAYGRGSPYHMLAERNGQVLYLGIDFIRALTLEHVAFDVLLGDHPIPDYYCEQTIMVINNGIEEQWRVLDHRQELNSRLATVVMKRMVLRSGNIRCEQLKGVKLGVMDAAPFLHWHLPLARKRGWPYWTLPITVNNMKK